MKKYFYLLIAFSIFLVTLSGCSSKGNTPTASSLPDWFYNPHYAGYMGVTSSAPVQKIGGIDGQRRVALLKARAELARIQNVHVESRSKIVQEVSKQGVKLNVDDYRKLSTAQGLDLYNVSIKDEWIDPDTGELYLWLVYPITGN